MVVWYVNGAPRRRVDAVPRPLGHGRAGLPTCSYADGQVYAEGGRRRIHAYPEGTCTPRDLLRGWADRPVCWRPRYLAVGVQHGRRRNSPFL
jgi:hypothetical protein